MRIRAPLAALLAVCLASPIAAQVSPESAEKYNAGQELYKKRRYQDAINSFEEAVSLDAKNAQAYRAMGKAYQKLRSYDKAIESYQMATSMKSDYVAAYLELGELQFLRKLYEPAQASFQRVLEIDGSFEGGKATTNLKAAFQKQGNIYFRQKNYKKAAEQYENATQVDPSDAGVFYNLGLAHRYARSIDTTEHGCPSV